MGRSMGIAKKIWLGVSILIVGYLFSMIFGFMLGKQTESRLRVASQSAFPASQQSQIALTAFEEQIKLYNDAVMLGDTAMIDTAKKKAEMVLTALTTIQSLEGISKTTKTSIKEIQGLVEAFTGKANSVYTAMGNQGMTAELGQQAAALAKNTDQIRARLTTHTEDFAEGLKSELTGIGQATQRQGYLNMIIFAVVVVAALVCVSLIITHSVSRPLKNTVTMLKDIAEGEGDLTRRLEIRSKDEVGELAQWFNAFMDNMHAMLQRISDDAQTLRQSSEQLSDLSGNMSGSADNVSEKSNTVAAASNQMSSNMNSVSQAMEEASSNVNMVATATEEMTATVNEIAQNSEKAKEITDNAVTQADTASERVGELGIAAQDIGKVAETITAISEQTNLLALNATIEAARAGDAGKGFAVVANEIKELAKQTAEATLEIKGQISGIQNTTEGTVNQIAQITKVINEVNDIVSTIATAVEEQSVTTQEIAGNVNHAARGLEEITGKVSQSSAVALEIARDIDSVNSAAGDMTGNSSQVDSKAEALLNLAEQLSNMVGRFKL